MAIQIRRGTDSEWESNKSNIVVGEPAIATDAERFFVGTASGDYAEFANLDVIAPAYDTSTLYVVGDVINRHGKLYSCNTPCSGAFNASYWDEKSLAEILKDLANEIDYAQYEIGYASGELITIDNGASEIPVKDLTIDIKAVQSGSGDPSPTNVRPISGWDEVNVTRTGKNLYGGLDFAQALVDYGYQTILDTRAQTVSFTRASIIDGKYTHNLFDKFPSSTATAIITYLNSGNNTSLIFTYSDGSYASITLPSTNGEKAAVVVRTNADKTVIGMNLSYYAENRTVIYYNESGIFDGHIITADQFKPYNRHVYSVTWEDEAGTVYGGSLDVTTGVLTVTHGYVDLGTLKWGFNSDVSHQYFLSLAISNIKLSPTLATPANLVCSHYTTDSYLVVYGNKKDGTIGLSTSGKVGIFDSQKNSMTAEQFKTAMSGVQLVYELATPQVVQLTPTQVRTVLGTNNIWNQMNSNNELTYRISNALN